MQSVPEDNLAPGEDALVSGNFKTLLDAGFYEMVAKLGDKMDDDELFMKYLCPAITTLEHYKGISKHLGRFGMLKSFLVHGDMALVKKVIVEFKVTDPDYHVHDGAICNAIILSFKENRHGRIVDLLKAVKARYAEIDKVRKRRKEITEVERFMDIFIERLAPEEDSAPFKLFLTLHGEELRNQDSDIFETFCLSSVYYLQNKFDDPKAKQLLIDFVGQPSLLTPTAFAKAFLMQNGDVHKLRFITCGWREAVEEGLKEMVYPRGGQGLWNWMKKEYPQRFLGNYPRSPEELQSALATLPTKQQRETAWAEEHAPAFQVKLLEKLHGEPTLALFPTALLNIISEYLTVTWTAFLQSSPPAQALHRTREQIYGQLQKLIKEGKYKKAIELGDDLGRNEFLEQLYPTVTTLDQFRALFVCLKQRNIIPAFLAHGKMSLIREVIVETNLLETDDTGECDDIYDAIVLSLKEDNHARVADLFEAASERPRWKEQFNGFVYRFFKKNAPEKDSMPLKRFLTLHGEQFSKTYPEIFKIVCGRLVDNLRRSLANPDSQKLLTDLIGQSSILTSKIFVEYFWNYLEMMMIEPTLSSTAGEKLLK